MKRPSVLVLALMILMGATACRGSVKDQSNNGLQRQKPRTLVVYFSMPETAKPKGMTQEEANSTVVINGEVLGSSLNRVGKPGL